MKKITCIIALSLLFNFFAIPCQSQDKIDFDGYWWGIATPEQKLGYVQGFMDGSGTMSYLFVSFIVDSYAKSYKAKKNDLQKVQEKISSWRPYNRSFGFYVERIDGFYQSTQSMKVPIAKIMLDLMTPPPR